jgi:F-type H+-transporting ATPase subunit a
MSATFPTVLPQAVEIHPGAHPTATWHGLTFNLDTIWVTIVAGAILVLLGFWLRHQLTKETEDHVPTRLQLIWETVVTQVQTQVEENLGRLNPYVVPLAVALFFFILIANWVEVVPSELNKHVHVLPSPTADTNLTYALAAFAMISVWTYGIRSRGLGGYIKHYAEPVPWMFPLEVLQDLLKPVTLALRLFGNIFAGGIMIALIAALVALTPGHIPLGGLFAIILTVAWKLFDTIFLGALQAFIFALLTVLYFGMAAGHGGHEEDAAHASQATESEPSRSDGKEPTPTPELV